MTVRSISRQRFVLDVMIDQDDKGAWWATSSNLLGPDKESGEMCPVAATAASRQAVIVAFLERATQYEQHVLDCERRAARPTGEQT